MQWKNPTTVTYSEINDTPALTWCNYILLEPYHPGKMLYKCLKYKENTSMDFEYHMFRTKGMLDDVLKQVKHVRVVDLCCLGS